MGEVVEVDSKGAMRSPARTAKPSIDKYYGVAGKPRYSTPEEIDEAAEREAGKALREELR